MVSTLQVPRTWTNVTETNNSFHVLYTLDLVVTDEIFLFPTGNYNAKDLVAVIIDFFDAAGIPVVCEYDIIRNAFLFSSVGPTTEFRIVASGSTCGRIFGFDFSNGDLLYLGVSSLSSNIAVDLTGTRSINLHSNLSTNNRDSFTGFSSGSTLARVGVSVAPLALLTWTATIPTWIYLPSPQIGHFHFELRDDENNLVDLNGAHWEATLVLDWVYRPTMQHAEEMEPLSLQDGPQPS